MWGTVFAEGLVVSEETCLADIATVFDVDPDQTTRFFLAFLDGEVQAAFLARTALITVGVGYTDIIRTANQARIASRLGFGPAGLALAPFFLDKNIAS
jgi:hypothetical protein